MLCTKDEEEKGLAIKDQGETSEDETEDEAFDDFKNNRDDVHLARNKAEVKKEKSSSKGGKKEDEQKDEETAPETPKDEKNQKLA